MQIFIFFCLIDFYMNFCDGVGDELMLNGKIGSNLNGN